MDHNSHTPYFWRDGYLVRHSRTTFTASFIDDSTGQPLFTARSTDLTKLVEFNDNVQQVMDGVRSVGVKEAKS